ncbi:MAG: hypothetical protein HWN67_14630 [Candidatus Helarchaeota archaeon]|nr:hypothetical protein [Candidatus Helarchaeota archaeon]
MKAFDSFDLKFKCFDFPKDQQIKVILVKGDWRIGKVKGLVRKAYRINPSYTIELTLKGEILPNDKLVDGLDFNPEQDSIKVMVSNPNKI